MCKPFRIASWSDPTLSYQLNDREKFEAIYKPKGFYVVVDEHRKLAERRRAARQAAADAANVQATDEPVLLASTGIGFLAEDIVDSVTGDVVVSAHDIVFFAEGDDDEPSAA